MNAERTKTVWNGSKSLRRFLVPIADLEPFPGNPRVGDVAVVRSSLKRFGQVRPILVDGGRIVAGHHVVLAATEEGWTHVAATPHEFESEEEARAYLVADNGTHDQGGYDNELLLAQLKALAETPSGLLGTGYDERYLEQLNHEVAMIHAGPTPPPAFPTLDPATLEVQHRCPSCGYEWSGNPAPGASGDEPEPDGDHDPE